MDRRRPEDSGLDAFRGFFSYIRAVPEAGHLNGIIPALFANEKQKISLS
jgi:hypothetical protein